MKVYTHYSYTEDRQINVQTITNPERERQQKEECQCHMHDAIAIACVYLSPPSMHTHGSLGILANCNTHAHALPTGFFLSTVMFMLGLDSTFFLEQDRQAQMNSGTRKRQTTRTRNRVNGTSCRHCPTVKAAISPVVLGIGRVLRYFGKCS